MEAWIKPTATLPDAQGHFGQFGGVFVPETLIGALRQLETEYHRALKDPGFQQEFNYLLREFVGRPSGALFRKTTQPNIWAARKFI